MGLQFFGYYLVKKGIIDSDQLAEATTFQRESNSRIGDFAIAQQYLSQAQVDTILTEQKKSDLMFGAIAINKGFLDEVTLKELLEKHGLQHVYIGQAIVEKGYLTHEQLSEELKEFAADQAKHRFNIVDKYSQGKMSEQLLAYCTDLTIRYLLRIADITTMARQITSFVRLTTRGNHVISVPVNGMVEANLHFCFSFNISQRIASGMSQHQLDVEDVDAVLPMVVEFCSIIADNLKHRCGDLGRNCALGVPVVAERPIGPMIGSDLLVAPLHPAKGFAMVGLDMGE